MHCWYLLVVSCVAIVSPLIYLLGALSYEYIFFFLFSEAESVSDSQLPFLPSVEVLVKALVVLASAVSASAPDYCVQLLLCSHHPSIVGTGKRDVVWKVSFLILCTSRTAGLIYYKWASLLEWLSLWILWIDSVFKINNIFFIHYCDIMLIFCSSFPRGCKSVCRNLALMRSVLLRLMLLSYARWLTFWKY